MKSKMKVRRVGRNAANNKACVAIVVLGCAAERSPCFGRILATVAMAQSVEIGIIHVLVCMQIFKKLFRNCTFT